VPAPYVPHVPAPYVPHVPAPYVPHVPAPYVPHVPAAAPYVPHVPAAAPAVTGQQAAMQDAMARQDRDAIRRMMQGRDTAAARPPAPPQPTLEELKKETERELAAVGCLLSEETLEHLCIDEELTMDDLLYLKYPALAEAVEDPTDLHKLWSAIAEIKNNRNCNNGG